MTIVKQKHRCQDLSCQINLKELQSKLQKYFGEYRIECFYYEDEGMIGVRVFDVPNNHREAVETRIYEFEDQYLSNVNCNLIPLVKSPATTAEFYAEY